jgi:hypothetical protein
MEQWRIELRRKTGGLGKSFFSFAWVRIVRKSGFKTGEWEEVYIDEQMISAMGKLGL